MPADELVIGPGVCCGLLEHFAQSSPSICRPILYDFETNKMTVGRWAIKLFKQTPGGGISKRPVGSAVMNYCPFCGEDLRDEASKGAKE